MKTKKLIIFFLVLFQVTALIAQTQKPNKIKHPLEEEYGYKIDVNSLTDGTSYSEFFADDSLIQIGTVIIDTYNDKIVSFAKPDSLFESTGFKPDVSSRFMQVDPLADKFPSISPYVYCLDNPINLVDKDGRAPTPPGDDDISDNIAYEVLSIKNSAYSLLTRPFGYEATFVKNSEGNYETGFVPTGQGFWSTVGHMALDGLSVASFGRSGPTGGLFAKAPAAMSILNLAKNLGGEFVKVAHSMSEAAAAYEKQITGVKNLDFKLGGVKFDGFNGKALLEAKGTGYANFVSKDGNFAKWFSGAKELVTQAKSQLEAAGGKVPIVWHVAEEKAFKAMQNLFEKNGIKGIDLKYTPPTN